MDISVITPFYKGNAHMEQLLGCIRRNAQNAPQLAIELILVNDSPDCPIVYDPQWAEGFSLRVLTNAQNGGIHFSRVQGLAQAEGTFIQFLDQDDLLDDCAFASQFALTQDVDVVLANGYEQNPIYAGAIYQTAACQHAATQARFYYRVCNQIVSPGQCLIRKDAIPQSWCQHIMHRNGSDDLLLWLLLFESGCRWRINPQKLYTHVHTGENLSQDISKMAASSMEVLQVLQDCNILTPKQVRRFLRSRKMAAALPGACKSKKLLLTLRYPDVALDRLCLRLYREGAAQ